MQNGFLRLLILLSLSGLAATPAVAQARKAPAKAAPAKAAHDHDSEDDEPPFKVTGGGKIPVGWTATVERGGPLANVKFEPTASGWHSRTASSVTLYRPGDDARGNYRVTITLEQTEGSPGHAEPYGVLLGAAGLKNDITHQRYTSFTIRGDGKFQIRRRAAGKGTDVTNGWVESDKLHQMDDKGRCSNALSVVVGPSEVQFLINGAEVHRAKRAEVDTDGIVALRISHNLDLNISDFAVTQG
jgi:hypothetical protein